MEQECIINSLGGKVANATEMQNERGFAMLKKIALTTLLLVTIVLIFNLVTMLAPNWQSNIRGQLALLDYWITLGYGSLIA